MLEQNGKVSLLKKQDNPTHVLVTDGEPDHDSIHELGLTEKDIVRVLRKRGIRLCNVFLMTVDDSGKTNVIEREQKK